MSPKKKAKVKKASAKSGSQKPPEPDAPPAWYVQSRPAVPSAATGARPKPSAKAKPAEDPYQRAFHTEGPSVLDFEIDLNTKSIFVGQEPHLDEKPPLGNMGVYCGIFNQVALYNDRPFFKSCEAGAVYTENMFHFPFASYGGMRFKAIGS